MQKNAPEARVWACLMQATAAAEACGLFRHAAPPEWSWARPPGVEAMSAYLALSETGVL